MSSEKELQRSISSAKVKLCSMIILVFEGFEHRKIPKGKRGNREGNNEVANERSALMPL